MSFFSDLFQSGVGQGLAAEFIAPGTGIIVGSASGLYNQQNTHYDPNEYSGYMPIVNQPVIEQKTSNNNNTILVIFGVIIILGIIFIATR